MRATEELQSHHAPDYPETTIVTAFIGHIQDGAGQTRYVKRRATLNMRLVVASLQLLSESASYAPNSPLHWYLRPKNALIPTILTRIDKV